MATILIPGWDPRGEGTPSYAVCADLPDWLPCADAPGWWATLNQGADAPVLQLPGTVFRRHL